MDKVILGILLQNISLTLWKKTTKIITIITIITTYIYNLEAHFQHQKLKAA